MEVFVKMLVEVLLIEVFAKMFVGVLLVEVCVEVSVEVLHVEALLVEVFVAVTTAEAIVDVLTRRVSRSMLRAGEQLPATYTIGSNTNPRPSRRIHWLLRVLRVGKRT